MYEDRGEKKCLLSRNFITVCSLVPIITLIICVKMMAGSLHLGSCLCPSKTKLAPYLKGLQTSWQSDGKPIAESQVGGDSENQPLGTRATGVASAGRTSSLEGPLPAASTPGSLGLVCPLPGHSLQHPAETDTGWLSKLISAVWLGSFGS